ncbi:unnamed protein product, partial [Ranitomeya imitator]
LADACAADGAVNHTLKPRVRFSNLMEVRQLPLSQALEAKLSRMLHPPVRDSEAAVRTSGKFTICQVAKISFFFCFVWFLANYSYQEALSDTRVAIVNIISSTSGLFTLILASIFPSNSGDRFTLSKLLAVILSIGGVVLVSLSGSGSSRDKDAIGKDSDRYMEIQWGYKYLIHCQFFKFSTYKEWRSLQFLSEMHFTC